MGASYEAAIGDLVSLRPEGSEYRRIFRGDVVVAITHGMNEEGEPGTCVEGEMLACWLGSHREEWRSFVTKLVHAEGEGARRAEEKDVEDGEPPEPWWRPHRHDWAFTTDAGLRGHVAHMHGRASPTRAAVLGACCSACGRDYRRPRSARSARQTPCPCVPSAPRAFATARRLSQGRLVAFPARFLKMRRRRRRTHGPGVPPQAALRAAATGTAHPCGAPPAGVARFRFSGVGG